MQIYNTLSKKKEALQSLHTKKISIYVCGITVYDYCHLGHARCYVVFDVVTRYLRALGYEVMYVRNITDIDDKIIQRANENNEHFSKLTKRFTEAMHEDFTKLGLALPDQEPRATDYIPNMIQLIEQLIKKNYAYVGVNGDVYYRVRNFSNYGCLSHQNIEQLENGVRIDVSDDKQDPLDFVLWKSVKPNEPSWESPWGEGRPGWHIECSAMSMQLLGKQFDIHGGGQDLIFPHHENEMAQSEALTQKPMATIWMHNGYLQINKEKMSKSLGNFFTIRDVLRDYSPEVLRYFLIASHYRSPLNYSELDLQQAKQALNRLYTALRFLPLKEAPQETDFEKRFLAAMDDDFNTPIALSILFEIAHEIQRLREQIEQASLLGGLLRQLGNMLGILQSDPELFFQADSGLDIAHIDALIEARRMARINKNWALADRIRDELLTLSISLEDGPSGTTWKKL